MFRKYSEQNINPTNLELRGSRIDYHTCSKCLGTGLVKGARECKICGGLGGWYNVYSEKENGERFEYSIPVVAYNKTIGGRR